MKKEDIKEIEYLSNKIHNNMNDEEFDKIIEKISVLKKDYPKSEEIFNLFIKLCEIKNNHDLIISSCQEFINFNKYSFNAYFIMSKSLLHRKEINKSIEALKKVIEIEASHYLSYFYLGSIMWQKLQIDDAILNFKKCLEINPSFNEAKKQLLIAKKERMDLLTYLTYENPEKYISNNILDTSKKLRSIKVDISLNEKITDEYVTDLYNKMITNVKNKNLDFDIEASQIHRDTTMKYECTRHFEIFDTFRIIPENCFSCFKIQVQPQNIIELFKLYIVFDKLKSNINLTRKCMVELRPNIDGLYKGFLYCVGINEANDKLEILNPILDKTIGSQIPRFIKRGCSEFSEVHPQFKEINSKNKNYMKYNFNWKKNENIIDNRIAKRNNKPSIQQETLEGISLKDLLIINNWLFYAKEMGDNSYKAICESPPYSKYIYNKIKSELNK